MSGYIFNRKLPYTLTRVNCHLKIKHFFLVFETLKKLNVLKDTTLFH